MPGDALSDVLYDACNSMARDANIAGQIGDSLHFMLLALSFVEDW